MMSYYWYSVIKILKTFVGADFVCEERCLRNSFKVNTGLSGPSSPLAFWIPATASCVDVVFVWVVVPKDD